MALTVSNDVNMSTNYNLLIRNYVVRYDDNIIDLAPYLKNWCYIRH